MTSKEFILWLKGFTEGVHEYNVTPKQWDLLKEKLAEVSDEPIRTSGYIAPYNVISGSSGTFSIGSFPNTTITYTATNTGINDFSPADTLNIGGQTKDKTLLND